MYGSPFIVDWAFKLTLCARWRKYFQTRRGDICIVVCRQNPLLSCYHKTLFCKPFEAFAQHFIGLTWAFVICLWGNLSYCPEFHFNTYIIRIGTTFSKSNFFYGYQSYFSLLEILPFTGENKPHSMMAFILFLQYKTHTIFVLDNPTVTRKLFISFLLFFFTYGSQNRVIFLKR